MFRLNQKKSSQYFAKKSVDILSTFLTAEEELLSLQTEQYAYKKELEEKAKILSEELETNDDRIKKTNSILKNIEKLLS